MAIMTKGRNMGVLLGRSGRVGDDTREIGRRIRADGSERTENAAAAEMISPLRDAA